MTVSKIGKPTWIVMFLGIFVVLISSCQQTTAPTLTSTPFPETPLPPTKINPTLTARPTPTVDTVIVQAHSFMDPVLEAIVNRSPDYQDDFSDAHSGWPVGEQSLGGSSQEDGVFGYDGGEYFVTASEAKFPQEGYPGQVITCLSAFQPASPSVLDFVMEVDARFTMPGNDQGMWLTKFWKEMNFNYGVYVDPHGNVHFHTNQPMDSLLRPGDRIETLNLTSLDRGGGPNHVVVVAKDSTLAITLNGEVAVYITNTPPHQRGPIVFVVCNNGSVPFRAQWDNLKIWHL